MNLVGIGVVVAAVVSAGLAAKSYARRETPGQKKHDLELAIRAFIDKNNLRSCEPGFYNGKEKDAAKLLGITQNEAYRMICLELKRAK